MRGVATKGRYFPIAEGSLASVTKTWRLTEKVRVAMQNPKRALAELRAIAKLRPGRDLVVFSLSIDVDQEIGSRAAARALNALSRWKDGLSGTAIEGRSLAIVIYLQSQTKLRIVEHRIKYSRGKFGAGEGLATSRKPRITSEVETELAVLPI
jgi:hypothetical protein